MSTSMGAAGIRADGTLVKHPQPKPQNPAAVAAAAGSLAELKLLPMPDLIKADENGQTPLIWAADGGHAQVVDFLVASGCDVNAKGFLENTAVSRASRNGHADALRSLLKAPSMATIDTSNCKLQSPLHFAAFTRQKATVQVLLEFGADTTVLDRKGRTPAEDTSDVEIRELILSHRARVQ